MANCLIEESRNNRLDIIQYINESRGSLYHRNTHALFSKNINCIDTPITIKSLKVITSKAISEKENYCHLKKNQDNEFRDCIISATHKACAVVQKNKKAIALDEEAMLPHHCSFIKLRTMAFDDDVGSICVNAVLHKNEFAKYSKGYSFESIPPLACISFFCCIAIVYCYERFYYHQREAYPQSSFFLLIINILRSVIFFSHSGKKRYISKQKDYAHHTNHVDDNGTSLKLVAVLAPLPAFLPVTIAHTKSPYSLTTVEAL